MRKLARPHDSIFGSGPKPLSITDGDLEVYFGDWCGVNILLRDQKVKNEYLQALHTAFSDWNESVLWNCVV